MEREILKKWDTIEEMNEELAWKMKSPWISVKDRLPEHEEMVLFYETKFNNICHGRYWGKGSDKTFCDYLTDACDYYNIQEVTHWMPLPEAPKDN